MDKNTVLRIAASQAVAIGLMLEGLDADTKGKDDVIGQILVGAGAAAQGFQSGNDGRFNAAVRAIRDAADAYLQSQGVG